MKYSDRQRIQKIYENANKLQNYILEHNVTKDDLLIDYSLQWLVTTPLYNIGEHAYYLSDNYKTEHSEIQWSIIAGLRHRLVHDYDDTNWDIIANIIFNDLPILLKQIKSLIDSDDKTDFFS